MNVLMNKLALTLSGTALALALVAGGASLNHAHADETTDGVDISKELYVTKTPTCGCCAGWVDIAGERGFKVAVTDTDDYEKMKRDANVPSKMQACHTTRVGRYVVEGHVPFEAIEKLMSERPNIDGIAVPGMPMGSPGMGNDPEAVYAVFAYGGDAGERKLFYTAGQ